MTPVFAPKSYLRPDEAADLARVHINTVYNWIASGKLEADRSPGGHLRISWAALQKILPKI